MLLNELALAFCLVLLLSTKVAALAALRRRDYPLGRVLQIFRLGLSLSACSYLLPIMAGRASVPFSLLGLFSGFAGLLLICVGWMEHQSLSRQRFQENARQSLRESDDGLLAGAVLPARADLPPLNSQARQALRHAQDNARQRRQSCIDTDHLLLGLLQAPSNAGTALLDRLGVKRENILFALGQSAGASMSSLPAPYPEHPQDTETPPLTDRARQVFPLAAQEARRFGKSSVGTDHLLLGLVLMGFGAAASVLLQQGVTVDALRAEILKAREA